MAKMKLDIGKLGLIILVAIFGLMFLGALTTEGEEGWEFKVPDAPGELALSLLKVTLITVFVFGAAALVMKMTGGTFSRKDYFKFVMIGVALWVLWEPVIQPILQPILGGAYSSIEDITISLGDKAGLFK